MTSLLRTGGGVMLHACGVVYKGQGYLFTGVGGAGKITIGRLWESQTGARVLNDDHIIVRKKGSQFYIFDTPWHGPGGRGTSHTHLCVETNAHKPGYTSRTCPSRVRLIGALFFSLLG